jgi:protein-S-isoprenylcysteine O-methyltransferase Ste14
VVSVAPLSLAAWCWIAWAVYWFIASWSAAATRSSERIFGRLQHLLPLAIGFALIFKGGDFHLIPGKWHHIRAVAYSGTALTAGGLLFSAWGRYHLGRYWSGVITLKEGHRLVRTGPYRLVRHPLYSGFLAAVISTAIAAGTYDALLGMVMILVAYAIKIRREEKVLVTAFGDEYLQFKRETPALIPMPWRTTSSTPKTPVSSS